MNRTEWLTRMERRERIQWRILHVLAAMSALAMFVALTWDLALGAAQ